MARALITALLAAALLAGCGGGDEASDDPGAPITFQLFGDAEELEAYRELVAGYGRETGREVQLIEVPDREAHLAKLVTAFGGGDPPDVFLINYRNFGGYAERRVVDPPGDRARPADFFEQPVEAFTVDGELQCVPQNISSLVVYWNRALFAQAGVAPPAAGWSWSTFVETARTLASDGVEGVGIDPSITRMAPLVWSNGGTVVDDDEQPTRTTLHEPAARGALQAVLDLIATGATPSKEQVAAQGLEEQFMTGKLAMFMSSRVEVPALREQRGLDFDVAPLPVLRQPASVLHSDAYCVASSAQDPAAAAEFIAYATGQQGQTITALGGRTVPSLRSVATSPAFLSPARPPASSQVFLDAVPLLRHTPVTPAWPEVEDVIGTQLERAFEDGVPLDEVLAEIATQADPLLAQ